MARGVLWALTWGPSAWAFPPLSPGSPQPATLTHLQGPCTRCSTCCCCSAAAPAWRVPSGLPVPPRATGSSIPDPTSQAPSPPSSLLTLLGLSSWSSSLPVTPTLFISLFSDRPCLGRNVSSWTSGTWPGSAPLCPVPTIEPEPRQLLDQHLIHVKMRTETRRGRSAGAARQASPQASTARAVGSPPAPLNHVSLLAGRPQPHASRCSGRAAQGGLADTPRAGAGTPGTTPWPFPHPGAPHGPPEVGDERSSNQNPQQPSGYRAALHGFRP